jgi:hypothetical protein
MFAQELANGVKNEFPILGFHFMLRTYQKMNFDIPSNPFRDGNLNLPSPEQLQKWLESDPRNIEVFTEFVERLWKADPNAMPPEIRELSEKLMAKGMRLRRVRDIESKVKDLWDAAKHPAGSMPAHERLSRSGALIEEGIEVAQEMEEPDRTNYMKSLLAAKEKLRQLKSSQ